MKTPPSDAVTARVRWRRTPIAHEGPVRRDRAFVVSAA